MARNIRRYGYGPNRSSAMDAVIMNARFRRAHADVVRLREQREQRLATLNVPPGTPLHLSRRIRNYERQNEHGFARPLTPRQRRRVNHKANHEYGKRRVAR